MELLPIVCEDSGELTGECFARPEVIAREMWCRTTNVYVMDSQGRILCHQRSAKKERLSGVWITHLGGHVGQDETYEENAQRELFEEAGIDASPEDLIVWRTTKIPKARVWVREFVVLKDIPIEEVKMQPDEVDQVAWLTIGDILENYSKDPSRWLAGTHDFYVEYHCLLAALTAVHEKSIGAWHPVLVKSSKKEARTL